MNFFQLFLESKQLLTNLYEKSYDAEREPLFLTP